MRDDDRIREASSQPQQWGTVIMTLAAVVGIGGVFAMGYSIGRRVERLAPCAAASEPRQVTERLDRERQAHDDLTFYDALMTDKASAPAAPALKPLTASSVAPAPVKAKAVAGDAKPSEAKPADANASVAAAVDRGAFTLQVSSVRRRDEAQALASAMTRQGLRPYITAATLKDKGTWYRVRVGRYESVQAANAAKAHLAQVDIPAWVLRID